MNQITIRGLPPEVEKEIRKISQATGKSLNRIIQEMIYQHAGRNKKPPAAPAASLRKLAGGWSEKEAADFLDTIKVFEQVDAEIWK